MQDTISDFDKIIENCRILFSTKLTNYGTAWAILRPSSLTDQILIKARRLRSIEEKGIQKIPESLSEDLSAIINYGIIALIQLERGFSQKEALSSQEAMHDYERQIEKVKTLMVKKNHDYGEAWRDMRRSSITDMILQKLLRLRQIENKISLRSISKPCSEQAEQYIDVINYAIFALILEGISCGKSITR